MKRKLLLALVVFLLVAAAAGGVGLALLINAHPSGKAPVITPTVPPLSTKDISRLEKALNNSDMKVQATALMPDLARLYLQQGQPLLQSGATLKILPGTKVCKDVSCKVDAIVTRPGGKQTTFVLYLDNSTGQWLIAGSSEKR
jgi:hypothetical protein